MVTRVRTHTSLLIPRVRCSSYHLLLATVAIMAGPWIGRGHGAGVFVKTASAVNVATTFNNGWPGPKPANNELQILNIGGDCYITDVNDNYCPDPSCEPQTSMRCTNPECASCSEGTMYVYFASGLIVPQRKFEFYGPLVVYGGGSLQAAVIDDSSESELKGVSGLRDSQQIGIKLDNGSITGPVSAGQLISPFIAVQGVSSTGSISLGNTSGSITVAENMDGSISIGSYSSRISAASIAGTVQLASGGATISAPTITGLIQVTDNFTGTIEANDLTPETIPPTWVISPSCGWYVKDLRTNTRLQVPCSLPEQANSGSPANMATNVRLNTSLTWTAGQNATSHKVYFGTTNPLTGNDLQATLPFGTTTFTPIGPLLRATTYYWRIDEVNQLGTTTGQTWRFTTLGARTTLRVKPGDQTTQNGSSWATAFKDLQTALNWIVAHPPANHVIWVAAGTYKPATAGNLAISFQLLNDVAIYGGFSGTETTLSQRNPNLNVVTLSGDIDADGSATNNSYHVVTASGVDNTAILDGFTIRGGNATGDSAQFYHHGGGLFMSSTSPSVSTPTIRNCIFLDNQAHWGGAISSRLASNPLVVNCQFLGNRVIGDNGSCGGGAVSNGNDASHGPLTYINCTFVRNTAQGHGGAVYDANSGGSQRLVNCTMTGNSTTYTDRSDGIQHNSAVRILGSERM